LAPGVFTVFFPEVSQVRRGDLGVSEIGSMEYDNGLCWWSREDGQGNAGPKEEDNELNNCVDEERR
jgi:hypothetical protein